MVKWLLVLPLLSGCATNLGSPLLPPLVGWPNLEVVHLVGSEEYVQQGCGGTLARACARPRLEEGRCYVYITPADMKNVAIRQHEDIDHCLLGRDHEGESYLKDLLIQFTNRQKNGN